MIGSVFLIGGLPKKYALRGQRSQNSEKTNKNGLYVLQNSGQNSSFIAPKTSNHISYMSAVIFHP
jgi:hypothetical protein